jgi:YHS domain-containing protein
MTFRVRSTRENSRVSSVERRPEDFIHGQLSHRRDEGDREKWANRIGRAGGEWPRRTFRRDSFDPIDRYILRVPGAVAAAGWNDGHTVPFATEAGAMLSTISMNPVSRTAVAARFAAAALIALAVAPPARAATPNPAIAWHNDFATALRAAQQSQRPVLAIFTASWSSAGATLERTALASEEAVAVITACFEPVCVDIDTNPEATRRHGVNRVPTVCVITPQDQLLTSFDLPEHPAQFVALAARAAQTAAAASAVARQSDQPHDAGPDTLSPSGGPSPTVCAFGSDLGDSLLALRSVTPPGTAAAAGGSVSAVAAKVRKLSDFASSDFVPGDESAVTASYRDAGPTPEPAAASPADPTTIAAFVPKDSSATAATATQSPVASAGASAFPSTFTAAAPPAPTTIAPPQPAVPQPAPPQPAVASTVATSPLCIEPGATLPATPATGSTPWLGLEPRPQAPASPSAVAANPAPARPIEPKPASSDPAAGTAPEKPKAATSPAASFVAALQKPFTLLSRSNQTAKTDKAESQTAAAAGVATPAAAAPAQSAQPDDSTSMPLGLEGYCPVTLAERGAWVEGRAQWGARHRGRTYLFAGAEQQQQFLSDPDRYAPVLSGDDPVLAFDAGRSTPGQRRYGVTYQSRMYLFSSTETRDAFAAHPQRYTTGALVAENRGTTGAPVVR